MLPFELPVSFQSPFTLTTLKVDSFFNACKIYQKNISCKARFTAEVSIRKIQQQEAGNNSRDKLPFGISSPSS
jgi:hypothetical protein